MVSSGFVDMVNSESKSSSIIYPPRCRAQRTYSRRFEAEAVIPLGKLLNGVTWRIAAQARLSSSERIPSGPRRSS